MASNFDKATHIHAPIKVWAFKGGSAGDHTVTGIATADKILGVCGCVFTAAQLSTAVPSTLHNLTSEFSILADDAINNTGGTGSTNALMFCFYSDWDA